MKISREGIVLIKSFEGFRPRAVVREEGGWVIGYGHTLSAREGASVSEADAELLLRYDLLPVERRVNEAAPVNLNQHQFDALTSFAFSVGLDRFEASDVLTRISAGSAGEAADAMMGWPEATSPEAGLRRRAAERALFVADPAYPVSLAQLLSAPLPPPAPVQSDTAADPTPEVSPPSPEPAAPTADGRGAAVAILLGEPEAEAEPLATPAQPDGSAPADAEPAQPPEEVPTLIASTEEETHDPVSADAETEAAHSEASSTDLPEAAAVTSPAVDEAAAAPLAPASLAAPAASLAGPRYQPYAMPIVGPLPGFGPADPAANQTPTDAQLPEPEETTQLVLTSPDDGPEPVFVRPVWPSEQRAETENIAPESGLFGEDLALTQGGGPIMGHEMMPEAPVRFDWSETGAFIIMGAVGLTAFGASMAAFRLASEQAGGGGETTIIGWVLAVIGFACVGVSSVNLYRRFGLPGGD